MSEREDILAALTKWDEGGSLEATASAIVDILCVPEFEQASLVEMLRECDADEMPVDEIVEDLINLYDIDDGPGEDDEPEEEEDEEEDGDGS